jgi:putative transposase
VTTPEEGEKRLEQPAGLPERDYESAARSLREEMAETFTPQRLKLPPSLYKCLATTNLIESPQSGVARRTANVKYWRDQGMAGCWVASAWLLTETVSEKSPAIVTCGRWPRFSDAKPRLKSRRRK